MKRLILICVLQLCICFASVSVAQGSEPIDKSKTIGDAARKVLHAIRNADATYLVRVADPNGITLGIDADAISKARFQKELSEKRGAHCIIFDSSCLNKHSRGSARSLRELLRKKPVTISVGEVQGGPDERTVTVRNRQNPNDILFTLFFRVLRD